MNKLSIYLIIGIFLFIFISGCLSAVTDAEGYADDYLSEYDYVSASSPDDLCKEGFCRCFACKNGTSWFWARRSLVGGQCTFIDECNQEKYEELTDPASGSEYFAQTFLIGAGPSFADFGRANVDCHDSLNLAIQWLVGDEKQPYDIPGVDRALCMLSVDVIPMYVLYSKSENIDLERTANISRSFSDVYSFTNGNLGGPAGPVIITTEFEYNSTKPGVVDRVVEQIHIINRECNDLGADPPVINCFVAVAPKIGDRAGLDAVMDRVGKNEVHMLAYGINSNYANISRCDAGRLREDASSFSRYALYNYSIPTIIAYVLLDANNYAGPEGCTMTEYDVEQGYAGFFPQGVQRLMDAGVIGIAPYNYNMSSGLPIECHDCALGANTQRFNSWFGGCQKLVSISDEIPSGGMPIIFPNESGGYCDYGTQADTIFHYWRDQPAGQELYSPIDHQFTVPEREDPLFRCDACIVQSNKSLYDYYPVLELFKPDGFPTAHAELCPDCQEPVTCYIYPEIDYYASRSSIDPMLMRAIIWKESNFNVCSAAKVCRPGYTTGCLIGDYASGYNEMHDPSGFCEEQLQSITAPDFNPAIAEDDDQTPQWRFAGLGIMQVMEPPYTFWPAEYSPTGENEEYWYEFERRQYDPLTNPKGRRPNMDGAIACSEEFNPFDATNGICMGARKLEGTTQSGRVWVDEMQDRYSCTLAKDTSEREILAAFYGIYKLTGIMTSGYDTSLDCVGDDNMLDCYARMYCDLKHAETACGARSVSGCTGNPDCEVRSGRCTVRTDIYKCSGASGDYLAYSLCIMKMHGLVTADNEQIKLSSTAGYLKLGAYQFLKDNCPNNYCPPYERIIDDLGIDADDPEKVNPDFDPNDPYSIYNPGGTTP